VDVAFERHFEQLGGELFGFGVEQLLAGQGGFVPAPEGTPGGVATVAFFELPFGTSFRIIHSIGVVAANLEESPDFLKQTRLFVCKYFEFNAKIKLGKVWDF
jgi:hypothetical protein